MNENQVFLLLGAGIGLILDIIVVGVVVYLTRKKPMQTAVGPRTSVQALAAKNKFRKRFGNLPELTGIGVGGKPGGYHVAVRLTAPASLPLPDSIDGVPIVVEIIGRIRPQ